jgi:hypothetical protein
MANEPRFEVYPRMGPGPALGDDDVPTGEFGWRFRAANGQISAIGGEGFTRREDAHRAIGDFLESLDAFDGSEDTVRPPALDVDE